MTEDELSEVSVTFAHYWPRVEEAESGTICASFKQYGKLQVLALLKKHFESKKFSPRPVEILGELRKRNPNVENSRKEEPETWEKFWREKYQMADGDMTDKVQQHVLSVAQAIRDMKFPPEFKPALDFAGLHDIDEDTRLKIKGASIRKLRDSMVAQMVFHKFNEQESRDWIMSLIEPFGFTPEMLRFTIEGFRAKGVPPKPLGKPGYVQARELKQ